MEPAVAVEGLRKRYGDRVAVDGVSFTVDHGEVVALLGANGAGKTTTVECVEGFRSPDAGTVRVCGADPRRERDAVTPRLGVMLQEDGVYQAATPMEMLRLYARLYPRPRDPRALLAQLGLVDHARSRIRTLSGGLKQRLNLALALVGGPEVAVLDEPTAGMDPRMRQRTWELVRGLRDDGVAVLLTTHLMDEAERLADRVAVLDRGQLLAVGTPAALVAADATQQVLVTTPAVVDAAALATAVGVPVQPDGSGRLLVAAGAEVIPAVSAWFAEQRLPITGLIAGGGGLEEVFFRLTDAGEAAAGETTAGEREQAR